MIWQHLIKLVWLIDNYGKLLLPPTPLTSLPLPVIYIDLVFKTYRKKLVFDSLKTKENVEKETKNVLKERVSRNQLQMHFKGDN